MPSIKLTYFPIAGVIEPARLAFAIGDIPFEDNRVTFAEWPALKASGKAPFGQLPILEVDGTVIAQSLAITRYAAKLTGLYPEDPLAAAQCDMVMDGFTDLHSKLAPSLRMPAGPEKDAIRKEHNDVVIPEFFVFFENLLKQNGGEYFVGDKLTIADLAIYGRCAFLVSGFFDGITASIFDKAPLLKALVDRVGAHPKVAAWVSAHAPLKLTYFNLMGLGEAVRWAFTVGDISFEDKRIEFVEWPALKATGRAPFDQLPILEVGNDVICQSLAIARYAGQRSGLYPTDLVQAAKCDMVMDCSSDIAPKLVATMGLPEAEKMAARAELQSNFLPMMFAKFERLLQEAGGEYFVGGKLSIADLVVASRIQHFTGGFFDGINADALKDCPLLSALCARVLAHPKIAAWVAAH